MRVGDVVERTGVSRKALRLYEACGILPPPRRTASGYRVYAPAVLNVLDFVQRGRRLGLTLAEIRHIIGLRSSGAAPCAHVHPLLTQKESDLKALLAEVRRILASWPLTDGLHAAMCPHIERKGGDATWKSTRSVPRAPRAPKIDDDQVRIGEDPNTAVLKKDEWNVLVALIQSGQLGRL